MATFGNSYNIYINPRWLVSTEVENNFLTKQPLIMCEDGSWNGMSSDQFGEPTAIQIGKGGLKGLSLSQEMVAEWINFFPVIAYLSDSMAHIYPDPPVKESKARARASTTSNRPCHKEEGKKRREMDGDDRRQFSLAMS